MVDFQERDTRRGIEGDDSTGEPDGAEDGTAGEASAQRDGSTDEPHHGDGGAHHDHGHHDHDLESLGVAILTVSSSRTLDEDPSGDVIQTAVENEGNNVVTRELVGDRFDSVQGAIDALVGREDVDLVVTSGGTGVTPDDVTIEAVRPLVDKELPGFGELFRRRSEDEIGTRVIGTRAMAGIVEAVPVFCLPGSVNAAELGVDLLLAEAGHLAGLANREAAEAADE